MSETPHPGGALAKNASGAVDPPSRRQKALEHFRSLLRALPGDTLEIEIAAIDYARAAALDAVDYTLRLVRIQKEIRK